MVKKHYSMFWLCCILIAAIAGCDSTNSVDPNNLQLTIIASPETLSVGEFSSITATLNNVDSSVSSTTGTSTTGSTITTTTTPVSGYPVTFSITQNNTKSTLTVVNAITDASGKAVAIYQAGTIPGLDVVQATLEDGKYASVGIQVTLVAPTTTTTS
jgi:hypothetical protein